MTEKSAMAERATAALRRDLLALAAEDQRARAELVAEDTLIDRNHGSAAHRVGRSAELAIRRFRTPVNTISPSVTPSSAPRMPSTRSGDASGTSRVSNGSAKNASRHTMAQRHSVDGFLPCFNNIERSPVKG
jgi:hypothetical protein